MDYRRIVGLGCDLETTGEVPVFDKNLPFRQNNGYILSVGMAACRFDAQKAKIEKIDDLFIPLFVPFPLKERGEEGCESKDYFFSFLKDLEPENMGTLVYDPEKKECVLYKIATSEPVPISELSERQLNEVKHAHNNHEYTIFSKKCWEEFWSNERRRQLLYLQVADFRFHEGSMKTVFGREKYAMEKIIEFRKKIEKMSYSQGISVKMIGDNVIFDYGRLSALCYHYIPDFTGFYYSSLDNEKYTGGVISITSMIAGIIYKCDPYFSVSYRSKKERDDYWMKYLKEKKEEEIKKMKEKGKELRTESEMMPVCNKAVRFKYLFDVPDFGIYHDHHPVNDATNMVFTWACVMAVKEEILTLNEKKLLVFKRKRTDTLTINNLE